VIGVHLIYEIYTIVSFDVCIGLPRGGVLKYEHELTLIGTLTKGPMRMTDFLKNFEPFLEFQEVS